MSTLFQGDRALFCSACRVSEGDCVPSKKMMRCSRCRQTPYCSVKCQKQHFIFHKHLCKKIYALLIKVNEMHKEQDNDLVHCKVDLATFSFMAAYQSFDTLERGESMMEISLKYYLDLLKLDDPSTFMYHVNDVALLLCALNQDMEAFSLIHFSCIVLGYKEPGKYFNKDLFLNHVNETTSSGSLAWIFPLQDVTMDILAEVKFNQDNSSMVFLLLLLLIKMKLVIQLQSSTTIGPSSNNAEPETHVVMISTVEQQIVQLVDGIHRRDPRILIQIRDTIPLTMHDVPNLYHEFSQFDETLYLLQDCFFLSPGVRSLLDDYVQDDELPIFDDMSVLNPTDADGE